VVRTTTSNKPGLASIVKTDAGIRMRRTSCDDLLEILDEEGVCVVGALRSATMARVDEGLRAAPDL
jgi:hypothetical protein